MNLPDKLRQVLETYGVAVSSFAHFAKAVTGRITDDEERAAEYERWLIENAAIDEAKAKYIGGLAMAEIASGNPGFDNQHGGGA